MNEDFIVGWGDEPEYAKEASQVEASPVSEKGFFEEVGEGLSAGGSRVGASVRKSMSELADYAGGREEYTNYSARRATQNLKEAQDKEEGLGLTGQVASMAAQSLPTAASFLLPGALPRTLAAGVIGAGQEFGDIMMRGEEENLPVTREDAFKGAMGAGLVDATMGRFLPVGSSPARRVITEALTGAASGSQHQIASNLAVGSEWNKDIGVAALGGGVAGGTLSGLNAGLQFKLNKGGEGAISNTRSAAESSNNVNPSDGLKTNYFEHANAAEGFREKMYSSKTKEEMDLAIDEKFGLDEQHGASSAFMRAQKLADDFEVPLTDAAYNWDIENITRTSSLGNAGEAVGISKEAQLAALRKNDKASTTGVRSKKAQLAGETSESHKQEVKERGRKAFSSAQGVFKNNRGRIEDMYQGLMRSGDSDRATLTQYNDLVNDLKQLEVLMKEITEGKKEATGETAMLVSKRAYKNAADLGVLDQLKGIESGFDPIVDIQAVDFLERSLVKEYPGYHQGSPDLAKERDKKWVTMSDLMIGGVSPGALVAKKAAEVGTNTVSGLLRQRGMRKRKESSAQMRAGLRDTLSQELAKRPGRPTVVDSLSNGDLAGAADSAKDDLEDLFDVDTGPDTTPPGGSDAPTDGNNPGPDVDPDVGPDVGPKPDKGPRDRIPVTKPLTDKISSVEKALPRNRTPDQVLDLRAAKEQLSKTNKMLDKVSEETRESRTFLEELMYDSNIDISDELAVKKLKNAVNDYRASKKEAAREAAEKMKDDAKNASILAREQAKEQANSKLTPEQKRTERITQKESDMDSWNEVNNIPPDVDAEARRRLGLLKGDDFNVQSLRKEQARILAERLRDVPSEKSTVRKYTKAKAEDDLRALSDSLGMTKEEGKAVYQRALEGFSEITEAQYNRISQKLFKSLDDKAAQAKKTLSAEEAETEKLRKEYEAANSRPRGMSDKTRALMDKIKAKQEVKLKAAQEDAARLEKSQEAANKRAAIIVEKLEKARKETEASEEVIRKVNELGKQEDLVRKRMESLGADEADIERFVEDNFSVRKEPLKDSSLQGLLKTAARTADTSKKRISDSSAVAEEMGKKVEKFINTNDIDSVKGLLQVLTQDFSNLVEGSTIELEIIAKQLEAFNNASKAVKDQIGKSSLDIAKSLQEAFKKAAEMKHAYPDNPDFWLSQNTYQRIKNAYMGEASYSSYIGDLGMRLRAGIYGTTAKRDRMTDEHIASEIEKLGGVAPDSLKATIKRVVTKSGQAIPVRKKGEKGSDSPKKED